MSKELIEQAKKLFDFLTNDPAGKLLIDSLPDYGIMALSIINPPLGMAADVTLMLANILDTDEGILNGVQSYVEHVVTRKFSRAFGVPYGEQLAKLAILKAKQAWQLIQIPKVKLALQNFYKQYIFQQSYLSYKGVSSEFSKFFDQDVLPNVQNVLHKAIKDTIDKITSSERLTKSAVDLDAAKLKDAINTLLQKKTIAGLDLNLGNRPYQEQLTPDVLERFNYEIDHMLGAGIDRYKELVFDDSIGYLEIDGQHYIGKINENNLPHGEGLIITANGNEKTIWNNGVQIKQKSNGGYSMLQNVAAIVSIVSGLYGIKTGNEQTDHLHNIHKLMQAILEQIHNLPQHIAAAFDKNIARWANAGATTSIDSIQGVAGYKTRSAIELEFQSNRNQVKHAFNLIKTPPDGNDKLAFAPNLYVCTNNLVAIAILEYIYLPDHDKEMIGVLKDVITFLNSYISNVQQVIDDRFSLANCHISTLPPAKLFGPARRSIYAAYNFDGNKIVVFEEVVDGGADISFYKKKIAEAMQKHKDKIKNSIQPTIESLKKVLVNSTKFIVEYVNVDILGHKSDDKENKNLISYLLDNTYEALRLKVGMSSEGKGRAEEAFQNIVGCKTDDVDSWAEMLSKDGYENMCMKIAETEEGKKMLDRTFKNRFDKDADRLTWILNLAELGWKKVSKQEALLFHDRGNKHREAERYHLAIEDYLSAISLDPDYSWSHNNLADCYRLSGRNQDAINSYKKAIAIEPDHYLSHHNLGECYQEQGQYKDAIAAYKVAIDLNKNHFWSHNYLADCYRLSGNPQEAIHAYKKAISIEFNHALTHHYLGNSYRDLKGHKDNKEAMAAYVIAISLDPGYSWSHKNLADCYRLSGRNQDAINAYLKAIAIEPDHYLSHHNLGECYQEKGQYKDAIPAYKVAIGLNKNHFWSHNYLADCYRLSGNPQEAIHAYKKAIDIERDHALTHHYLGNSYRDLKGHKDNKEAMAAYVIAINLDPGYSWSHKNLADCYRVNQRAKLTPFQRPILTPLPPFYTPNVINN